MLVACHFVSTTTSRVPCGSLSPPACTPAPMCTCPVFLWFPSTGLMASRIQQSAHRALHTSRSAACKFVRPHLFPLCSLYFADNNAAIFFYWTSQTSLFHRHCIATPLCWPNQLHRHYPFSINARIRLFLLPSTTCDAVPSHLLLFHRFHRRIVRTRTLAIVGSTSSPPSTP